LIATDCLSSVNKDYQIPTKQGLHEEPWLHGLVDYIQGIERVCEHHQGIHRLSRGHVNLASAAQKRLQNEERDQRVTYQVATS